MAQWYRIGYLDFGIKLDKNESKLDNLIRVSWSVFVKKQNEFFLLAENKIV